jgi:hypothetical protein
MAVLSVDQGNLRLVWGEIVVWRPMTRSRPVDQGSGRSFEEFFAATYGRLVGLLFAFLHDQAQAEDVAQDAFASALLRWRVVRGYHDPEAWAWAEGCAAMLRPCAPIGIRSSGPAS